MFQLLQDEFERELHGFCQNSQRFPGYEWKLIQKSGQSFGVHKRIETPRQSDDIDCCLWTWEMHIVYSASFQVPVLYFNVYGADGRLIPLSHIWSQCPDDIHASLMEDPWKAITQNVHPLFNNPWYHIHPCNTANTLNELILSKHKIQPKSATNAGDSQNVVVKDKQALASWLSIYGSIIGLELPLEMLSTAE